MSGKAIIDCARAGPGGKNRGRGSQIPCRDPAKCNTQIPKTLDRELDIMQQGILEIKNASHPQSWDRPVQHGSATHSHGPHSTDMPAGRSTLHETALIMTAQDFLGIRLPRAAQQTQRTSRPPRPRDRTSCRTAAPQRRCRCRRCRRCSASHRRAR